MATWAKGIDFKNSANTTRVGGVGVYGSDTAANKIYLGLGSEPWNNSGLEVTSSNITFKGNKIYHAGDKPTLSELGAAASNHTHSYLPLGGGTMTGSVSSSLATTTHLNGNKGVAIINSTASGSSYNMLAKMNSTNGVWTIGSWGTNFDLFYTANSIITAGTNNYSKRLTLLNENGNSSFPGVVSASSFSGSLSGNASTATKLQTARTINGTSFDGSANITTANWGTARTITIGSTGKSVNGSGNVSWSLTEIGAAASSHTHNYLPLSGGTLTGLTIFRQGSRVHTASASGGTSGYLNVAQIKISSAYVNQPIFISLVQRGNYQINTLEILFTNTSTTDPALSSFVKTGSVNAFIYKSATSTWDLYIQKTESYDSIDIIDLKKGNRMDGVSITWNDVIATTLPTGNVAATLKAFTANVSGNAGTATKLQTIRTINGTNFDGSGNITTANWGTARTLTIGSTGKSVNGSGNVSWSLSEIGAAAASHTHNYAGSSSAGGAATSALACTGNSATATKLQTARTIFGKSFDGSGNVAGKALVYGNYTSTASSRYGNGALEIRENGLVGSAQSDIGYAPQLGFHWSGKIAATLAMSSGGEFQFINQAGTGYSNVRAGTFYGAFSGNASTATTLQNTRTINGTSFNGSANITTANWGTARTLTIGSTGKSVNGSGNVSWSLSEIGAAASSHTHNYAASPSAGGAANLVYLPRVTGSGVSANYQPGSYRVEMKEFGNDCTNTPVSGYWYHIITGQGADGNYNTQLALGMTTQAMYYRYRNAGTWGSWKQLAFTDSSISGNSGSATKLQTARTINGTSFNGSANITTANWGTARTLTIGNTGKSVNGSGNVSWSLAEIGAAASAHDHNRVVTSNSGGVYEGNGDAANSTTANLQIKSWWGIGFAPSISGQGVPQNQNAVWMDVRNGHVNCRGNMTANGTMYAKGAEVVAYGNDGGRRHWVRYYDGTQICWGEDLHSTGDFNMTGASANNVFGGVNKNLYFPVTFASKPVVTISVATNGYTDCQATGISTSYFLARAWNNYSTTVSHLYFSWMAIGRWK